jgi:hypothetical protein
MKLFICCVTYYGEYRPDTEPRILAPNWANATSFICMSRGIDGLLSLFSSLENFCSSFTKSCLKSSFSNRFESRRKSSMKTEIEKLDITGPKEETQS